LPHLYFWDWPSISLAEAGKSLKKRWANFLKTEGLSKGRKMVKLCCAGGVMGGRGSKIALWIVLALAPGLSVYPYIHTAETEV